MSTLKESVDRIARQLDDEENEVWTLNQLESFVQEGYDRLCREAQLLFDMVMFDSSPHVGNYTRDFERDYMYGMVIFNRFNYTKDFDRDYVGAGSSGPANHTKPYDAESMSDLENAPSSRREHILPDTFVSVDRVTHDWTVLNPESARFLRRQRNTYETEESGSWSYSMDQDGLFKLRLVGIPPVDSDVKEVSGVYGVIRRITEFNLDSESVVGTYGIIRQIPAEFSSNSYGAPRRIVTDDGSTRVELFRLGGRLDRNEFEIPERFVKYCEWWALYRAYSTPGEGEDKQMADHYMNRFQDGLQSAKRRIRDVMRERTIAMGSKRARGYDAYLQHFPSDYGTTRPFRGPRR